MIEATVTCGQWLVNGSWVRSGECVVGPIANELQDLDVLGGVVLHQFDEQAPQRGLAYLLQLLGELLELSSVSTFCVEQLRGGRHDSVTICPEADERRDRRVAEAHLGPMSDRFGQFVEQLMVATFISEDQIGQIPKCG